MVESGRLIRGLLPNQGWGCSVFCGLDHVHTQGCVKTVLGSSLVSCFDAWWLQRGLV